VNGLSANTPIPGHLAHRATVGKYAQDRFIPLLRHAQLPHCGECHASTEVAVGISRRSVAQQPNLHTSGGADLKLTEITDTEASNP